MYNNSLNKNTFKKKLKEVPVNIKINALKELERGTSVYDIAKELDVSHTTVRLWKKKKDILIYQNSSIKKPTKRFRKQQYDKINKAVWTWFKTARASGMPISGPMIQAKALNFSAQFNEDNTFTASNGWLRSWKNYYGISSEKICSKKLSADSEAVDPLKGTFENYVQEEELTPGQVFNADESGLSYKLLPKTTLCEKTNESPADVKGCEEALTVSPWAERVKIFQDYLYQQQQIRNSFEIFCTCLQSQQDSTALNASDLQKWQYYVHTDVENHVTDKNIVEIVQEDEQHETNDDDENKKNVWNYEDNNNNDSVTVITEVDAKQCIKLLREFCEKKNYSKSIAAIDIIEKEIQVKSLKDTSMK